MNRIHIQYHKTSIGEFIIGSFEDKLCLLDYRYRKMRKEANQRIQVGLNAEFVIQDNQLLQETRSQINEYVRGDRTNFDIPILMVGTDFQKSVWEALLQIPYGETSSYLELSKNLGNEKAIRAVAAANGAIAMAIIIPCHRIIGSNGELVGYAGGLPAKKQLLVLEGSHRQLELF